jgi:hypothetical protein
MPRRRRARVAAVRTVRALHRPATTMEPNPRSRPAGAKRSRELNPHRALLEALFHELAQTERSAEIHPPREADRLGDVPPARPLRALAEHAKQVRSQVAELAHAREVRGTKIGSAVGDLFSIVRRAITDPMMDAERSYRATLLGMRHGVDLVKLMRVTADAGGDAELVLFCDEWLSVREPLVEDVCEQLEWFGWHPERATRQSTGLSDLIGWARRARERTLPSPT